MLIFVLCVGLVILAITIFINQSKFGQNPTGHRLERIKRSPNYKNGSFQNRHPTPDLTEGANIFSVLTEFLITPGKDKKPLHPFPVTKTDLLQLSPVAEVLVWFGHSSYFIQTNGKKILVDPVLSGAASPVAFTTRAFKGTDVYTTDDIPAIDFMIITHDHWDHLDFTTIKKLRSRIEMVICGLGIGAHLEHWGFPPDKIIELDWNEDAIASPGFHFFAVPARHFSGRGFKRNQTLWSSFVVETPTRRIFVGGDSGFDTHFAEIGARFGEIDLAILENGQYDKSWKYIHMMPEEVLKAGKELNAKVILPVHSSKFALANHAWDEPLRRITAANTANPVPMITPMIGERVNLGSVSENSTPWWLDRRTR